MNRDDKESLIGWGVFAIVLVALLLGIALEGTL